VQNVSFGKLSKCSKKLEVVISILDILHFPIQWSLENPFKKKKKKIFHCISVWLTYDGIIGGILLVQNVLCSEIIIFS